MDKDYHKNSGDHCSKED